MGDDERGPAAPQRAQPVLDGGLALRVEAGRGLVEDQDARISEDRPRNRDPLALAAGELHAPLTHDGVVTLLEATHELIAVGDPRRLFDVLAGRVRPGECDVLRDRAVEQEVVLQHDAELPAVVGEPQGGEIGRAHRGTPGTWAPRMPHSAWKNDDGDTPANWAHTGNHAREPDSDDL